ncbi:MAG: Hsp20/alpha crystallin family protein [Cyclobacteriaceae bacterium]|nr:Hsp20/alpha crystallin family protein [Cyclobacteriaceae bacterium]
MTLIKYNPNHRSTSSDPFLSMFDKFFYDTLEDSSARRFLPQANILESEKTYEIHMAIPGMKKDGFNIDLEDGKLHISGERNTDSSENVTVHRQEIVLGSFRRIFQVPEDADQNKISASYTDGILKIQIPRDEKKTLKHKISVK